MTQKIKITESVSKKIITLPIHGDLSEKKQLKVIQCLKKFYV